MTDEFEDLKNYIGVSETDEDVVVASTIAKLAATIGVDNPAPNQTREIPSRPAGTRRSLAPPHHPESCAKTARRPFPASPFRSRCRAAG